jgi:hypothetical protein
LGKHRAVIEVLEKAGRNSNCRLTGQMVEKKVTQLKLPEINLITNKLELTFFQELISGKPGIVAACTFFKH